MGFFKCLGYVAAGVGAVVLAPATGGSSIALAIGALGTTTAAGAAIGVGLGATAAAVDHAVTANMNRPGTGRRSEALNLGKRRNEPARQYVQSIANRQRLGTKNGYPTRHSEPRSAKSQELLLGLPPRPTI